MAHIVGRTPLPIMPAPVSVRVEVGEHTFLRQAVQRCVSRGDLCRSGALYSIDAFYFAFRSTVPKLLT